MERERFEKRRESLVEGLDARAEEALICWSVPSGRVDQKILVRKACVAQGHREVITHVVI